MKILLTRLGSLLLLLCMTVVVSTAQKSISGTVTDAESNEALIGANILVKDSSAGTITDIDGNYTIDLPAGSNTIIVSYTGYSDQMVSVGDRSVVNVALAVGQQLDEVVVVGYGSQSEKEITSSVVKVSREDFNQGAIADPAQLLQGKVAGLQVYNRGGDPNSQSTIRLRGISTVGANVQPLVVVDGVIGASLENVDPNDIESVNVLKDGSAAAIYGSRGSSGVIIVTTKKGSAGSNQGVKLSYSGQFATSSPVNGIKNMTADEFRAAGGTDLGSSTDWIDEVTQNGFTQVHGISATGGFDKSSFRVSANLRNVDGILKNSGFDQFNTRLNFTTRALDDKLKVSFNTSYTDRDQQNGFNEALRYAVLYNPTAPVQGADSPFPFNADQFGGYFETLGLFDSFNPVSLIEQNINNGDRTEFNYGANLDYSVTDALTVSMRIAQQKTDYANRIYYPTTSLFNGNATSPTRKGLAEFYEQNTTFKLYEGYATYLTGIGENNDLTLTGGYSYQQNNFDDSFFSVGDFPNDDYIFADILEASQDLQNAGFIDANSNRSPDEKIIAFFGRANLTLDNKIFLNASIRREGSTKLGPENRWGWFPALGVGVDLNQYLDIAGVDQLKVRLGYGVTGALPGPSGLSQELRQVNNEVGTGAVSTTLLRAANDSLKWEQKAETNLGVEFASGRFGATLDLYNRDISDFILERTVDVAVFGVDRRFENAGKLNTKGLELALNYDAIQSENLTWNTGVVLSTYKTVLEEYVLDAETRANLGAPGQNGTNVIRVKVGEEIGQIWGPVYDGVDGEGNPIFQDVNGDGMLVTGQDKALDPDVDFAVLGNGTPDLELGWTNQLQVGKWNINAFFRGAFGHSLVNTFRAFYEPQVSTQSSYNFMNTDLAVDGLTTARFSSLYVEKGDFFKLDNLTISRGFDIGGSAFENVQFSLILQNPLVFTSYTGTDPEPSLVDSGPADNGSRDPNYADVLAPGLDRRNSYFASRSITLGVNLNF